MREPEVTELLDGVYDVTWQARDEGPGILRGARRRSYLFDGDVPTLVDTCVRSSVDALVAGIESTGIDPERLLLTHAHLDHAGAVDEVVERFGVETWAHRDAPVTTDGRLDVTTDPDDRFESGDRIGRFEAVHVGGHSPGSSVFVDEAAGVAAMGDAVSGSDRRGLPAGYLIHPPQATNMHQPPEEVVAAEANLVRLLDYDYEVALVHHGSNVLDGASEKLTAYVDFEPGYADPEAPSLHRRSREGMPDDELRAAFQGGE